MGKRIAGDLAGANLPDALVTGADFGYGTLPPAGDSALLP
jgi:hypothetical protein